MSFKMTLMLTMTMKMTMTMMMMMMMMMMTMTMTMTMTMMMMMMMMVIKNKGALRWAHLAADLHHKEDGHEPAHGLVVELLVAAAFDLRLEVEPQVHGAHHKPRVDEMDLALRVLVRQRHEHLVAVCGRVHL
jgi:hypothetical protein